MKKYSHFPVLTAVLLALVSVGAGCFPDRTPSPGVNDAAVNAPAANAPVDGPGGSGSGVNADGSPAPGLKRYNSAPYDFSYPSAYIITDIPMVDSARKPYLDAGLDAPLQFTMLATVTRPPGFQGEGPPTIHVIQWNNTNRTPLREWARKQAGYTGFTAEVESGGKASADAFKGRPSLSYEYDGLYGGKARLIDLDGTVLQVSADFDAGAGDTNMAAFDRILSTLVIAE